MTECELGGDQFQLRMKMALPIVNLTNYSEIVSSLSLKRFKWVIEKIGALNECFD